MPARVLDLINTAACARDFLALRVAEVNATGRYANEILCAPGPAVDELRAAGLVVHALETPRADRPLRLVPSALRLLAFLRAHRYDVVHTHARVAGLLGRVVARLAGARVVVHQVHGFPHTDHMPSPLRRALVAGERGLVALADRVLLQSPDDLAECARGGIAPRGRRVLVGNGVPVERFDPDAEPERDPPVILWVTRFDPIKRPFMVLAAARRLAGRGVRFRLEIAGEGRLRAACERRVRERGLDDAVRFLGHRRDVPALVARAAVCVHASLKEGLPRVVMEAAAGGRPVVTTDVRGNRDVVTDGVTGFLVPLDDAAAMADRLALLLSDEALRRRMGRAAAERARARFDERAVARRIVALYDELLAASAGASAST